MFIFIVRSYKEERWLSGCHRFLASNKRSVCLKVQIDCGFALIGAGLASAIVEINRRTLQANNAKIRGTDWRTGNN